MKKIIVGFMALALLLMGNSAFASGPFNGQDGDCPNMGIGNYTTGAGIGDGQWNCWTTTNISANSGQVINVGMFYHNNTSSTLTNVEASLSQSSTGPGTSFTFTGNMSSDQGSTSLGTVSLNLTSSQTVTFNSAYWFKNKHDIDNDIDSPFPSGQSPSSLMNGGVDLGSVPPGWDDYGYVVAVFRVGENNNGGGNNCVINNFTINNSTSSATITSGSSANLAWSTSGCSSVTITGPNGTISNSPSSNASVSTQGTYRINATGNTSGTITRSVELYVNDNNTYCTISNFTINNGSSATIQQGGSVNLSWSTSGYNSVTVSGPNFTSYQLSDTRNVYPGSSGQYTLTASGSNCSNNYQTRTVYVNVNQAPVLINDCAVTTVATNVTTGSATLNGLLTGSAGTSYFQYGTTVNLGSQTVSRTGNGSYSEVITGLAPNTVYYFRLVSNCSGGLSYGQIQVFSTLGIPTVNTVNTVRQVVVQGTTVVGTSSPIMLKIENRYQYIGVGDIVDYTVTYKNIGKTLLTHPVLQVIVPRGIVIINSSRGTYSTDTNTLTVQLEDLFPGAEGVVYLQGRVDSITSGVAQIVTTAILVYTSPSGAQENAIAYVLNNPRDLGSVLGASAFWSGFWGIGLIGWLLILILILLIVLLTRRYYGGASTRSVVQKTTPTGMHTTTTTNY